MTGPRPMETPEPSPQGGARISPFYRRYLKDQAAMIRAKGGSDEDVRQFVQLDMKAPLSAAPMMTVDAVYPMHTSNLRGISMAAVQGATFGFGDEAIGAILGLATGVGARQGIEEYRQEYADWAREHGGAALAAEIIGGIATGGVATGAAATRGILAGIATGAGFGALGGAGASNNIDFSWNMVGDRFKSALVGAAGGAVVGGAAGAAGRYLGPLVSDAGAKISEGKTFGAIVRAVENVPLLGRLERFTPEGRARELLSYWAQHSGVDAGELLKRAESYWAREQRPTIIDLMGDQFTEFARGVLKDRTPIVQQAVKLLEQRQVEQGDKLLGQLVLRTMDNPKLGLGNIYAAEDALHKLAKQSSAQFYSDAHEQVVKVTPAIKKLMARPEFRAAWNRAAKLANDELETGRATGLVVPRIKRATPSSLAGLPTEVIDAMGVKVERLAEATNTNFVIPDELPVRGIDYLKRALQEPVLTRYAQMGRLTNATRTLRDNELGVLETRYKQLLAETIEQAPVYGKALSSYSGPVTSRDAVRKGFERFTARDSYYEVMKDMKGLSPADRDFYRLGALRALHDRLSRNTDPLSDISKQLFGAKGLRWDDATGEFTGKLNGDARRLLALFSGSKGTRLQRTQAARDFVRLLAGESTFAKTAGSTRSLPQNIPTQKLIQASTGTVPPVRAGLGINIASAARQEIARDQIALSQAENNAVAELFTKGLVDPDDLRVLIDDLAYDALQRPVHLAKAVTRSVAQKAGRTVAGLF